MTAADNLTSSITGHERLKQAAHEFYETLEDYDKQKVSAGTAPADVKTALDFLEEMKLKRPKLMPEKWLGRFEDFITYLQRFTLVVDTFVSSNPMTSALIWGSIKCLLLVCSESCISI